MTFSEIRAQEGLQVITGSSYINLIIQAEVVKLVDTPDLGSGAAMRGGSSPLLGIKSRFRKEVAFFVFNPLYKKLRKQSIPRVLDKPKPPQTPT